MGAEDPQIDQSPDPEPVVHLLESLVHRIQKKPEVALLTATSWTIFLTLQTLLRHPDNLKNAETVQTMKDAYAIIPPSSDYKGKAADLMTGQGLSIA